MGVNLFENRTNEGGGQREVCPEDKLFSFLKSSHTESCTDVEIGHQPSEIHCPPSLAAINGRPKEHGHLRELGSQSKHDWCCGAPLEWFLYSLLAPKASEASKGAFYLCPGVVSGYCDAWARGYCACVHWMCNRGSPEKWQIHTQ